VVEITEPHCWRLIHTSADGEPEEAVFNIHGVIVGKDLPPVVELPKMSMRTAPFLRQWVTLTGLSHGYFETAVDRVADVYDKFRRFFPENQLQPWSDMNCTLSEGRTLTFSNRFFTRRSEAPTLRPTPIPDEVDPKGLLKRLAMGPLFHSRDNEVQYYRRYKEDEVLVHDFVNPQSFRIGDIVDVQFSFVVYRMRTGHHIMKPMLFSLALAD
ncbi:hypothetical protein BDN72DRAFT_720845, partial [Pluteus cervinus]